MNCDTHTRARARFTTAHTHSMASLHVIIKKPIPLGGIVQQITESVPSDLLTRPGRDYTRLCVRVCVTHRKVCALCSATRWVMKHLDDYKGKYAGNFGKMKATWCERIGALAAWQSFDTEKERSNLLDYCNRVICCVATLTRGCSSKLDAPYARKQSHVLGDWERWRTLRATFGQNFVAHVMQ